MHFSGDKRPKCDKKEIALILQSLIKALGIELFK